MDIPLDFPLPEVTVGAGDDVDGDMDGGAIKTIEEQLPPGWFHSIKTTVLKTAREKNESAAPWCVKRESEEREKARERERVEQWIPLVVLTVHESAAPWCVRRDVHNGARFFWGFFLCVPLPSLTLCSPRTMNLHLHAQYATPEPRPAL